jgi:hypothetical protein
VSRTNIGLNDNSNLNKTSGSFNNTVDISDDISTKSNTAKKSSRTPTTNQNSHDKKSSRGENVEVSKRLS